MRITNNMLVNNMMNSIGNNLSRMDKYQKQMATGKKISVPSDDPVVAARALKLRTDVAEVEQYKRNATDAQSWMDITESTLSNIGDVLQRARELAVKSANGTNTQDDMQKTAEEIEQLRTQAIHLANATYAGRYIFSGFKTDSPLVDETTGTFALNVANTEKIKYEIGVGDNININITGGDLFNSGLGATSGSVPSFIATFDNFITALNTGNSAGVSSAITSIDTDLNNVLRIRADVGARQNRIELTINRLESDTLNFSKLMSENEDVDMAETIMNLQNEENVYKASLSGGARVIQPTLVDFLK